MTLFLAALDLISMKLIWIMMSFGIMQVMKMRLELTHLGYNNWWS